jgi:drug/metabolite transporter (DMT)-like permease
MSAGRRVYWTRGALYGVASAALFGLSAPLSKRLLPDIGPMLLAGLLYLGAGAGLPIGPTLLLIGLRRVSGVLGSLLLNLEAVFTMVLAVVFFRDRLAASEWIGALFIVSGAAVVSYRPGQMTADSLGVLAVAGACLCWGFDNNLLQRVSSYDPVSVVQIKALSAGTISMLLALTLGQRLVGASIVPAALALGFVCYGISIVFDVYALRYLGAAREAAFFATAPFLGALAAVPLLGDRLSRTDAIGAALMALGVATFRYRAKD